MRFDYDSGGALLAIWGFRAAVDSGAAAAAARQIYGIPRTAGKRNLTPP
jgi:hypothetical protein